MFPILDVEQGLCDTLLSALRAQSVESVASTLDKSLR